MFLVMLDKALEKGIGQAFDYEGVEVTAHQSGDKAPDWVAVMRADIPEEGIPGWRCAPIPGGFLAVRGEWTHELSESSFVNHNDARRYWLEIDAEYRHLSVTCTFGDGTPGEHYYRHVLAFRIPAGIDGNELANELLIELDLEDIAARWRGIEWRGGNRVGVWEHPEEEVQSEFERSLDERISDICQRLIIDGYCAETCEQRIERLRQEMSTFSLIDTLVQSGAGALTAPDGNIVLVDPQNAADVAAAYLAAYLEEQGEEE